MGVSDCGRAEIDVAETHLIMVTTTLTLPRYRHLNLLFQYCLKLTNKADMSQTLLHHNGNSFRAPFPPFVNRIF